ncbi:hypothetical protein EHS25_007280 [Saitozyma podzolica]|uniref:Uncharacterized protein n=1 Tax=Saitozyma podzolica TaxID=1890683 RepID=A0A427XMR6_9TREE|nr:hypothetical protein EHS25_007280 [Saitozyma podzolica]
MRTPPINLLNLEFDRDGPWSFGTGSQGTIIAGKPFNISIQCDAEVVGKGGFECADQWAVHFRGPLAVTIPTTHELYHHDAATGTTVVTCTLQQSGVYEVWAWYDLKTEGGCPANNDQRLVPKVRGSGQKLVTVARSPDPTPFHLLDNSRPCSAIDYRTMLPGRWVSIAHIRPEYKASWWGAAQIARSESVYPSDVLPGYIYLPYQCKRRPLDYARSVSEIKDMKHVVYIGDSILRTSVCGHLYRALNNGTASGACAYSDDMHAYQIADRTWEQLLPDKSDPRGSIRFTQHFVNDWPAKALEDVDVVVNTSEPVTHVVANIGMWFGHVPEEMYINQATYVMDRILTVFGTTPRYTWMHTTSIGTGIFCYDRGMKRIWTRRHRDYATTALRKWHARYPEVRLNIYDPWPIMDGRHETASDGRHWVKETWWPSLTERPHVGAADDASMEGIWDAWHAFYIEEKGFVY